MRVKCHIMAISWRQASLPQLVDGAQEPGDELGALFPGAMFVQQQGTETLLEAVDEAEHGLGGQIGIESGLLFGLQLVPVAPHQRQQAAVLGCLSVDVAPTGQEMRVDPSDHGEAVGDDAGVGKVLSHQGAIRAGQIHANHPHLGLAFPPPQTGLQRLLAAAQHHIEDLVASEVAKRGGIAVPAGKEVLVDAQHGRTAARLPFVELALQTVPEVALHGGRAEPAGCG